jgi:predicted XRE-type DNA-binding protein
MSDDFELVRGSGNVFADFGYPDADVRHTKAVLAAEIMKVLEARQWSTRKAEDETGVDHSDFARIRRVKIGRYSIEKLTAILEKLGQEVELTVKVRPAPKRPAHAMEHV